MTKQEFISRQKQMNHVGTTRAIVWVVLLLGTLIGGIPLGEYVERHANVTWLGSAAGVGFVVLVIGLVVSPFWMLWRQHKQFGHRCPSCKKALFGQHASIAIATDHCGLCGDKVFDDAPKS